MKDLTADEQKSYVLFKMIKEEFSSDAIAMMLTQRLLEESNDNVISTYLENQKRIYNKN